MELFLALLMTVAAVSYPVFIDMRRHGTENIIKITAQDVVAWVVKSEVVLAFDKVATRGIQRAVVILKLILMLVVAVLLLLQLIWW